MKSIATQPHRVSLWGVVVGVLILTLASASLVLGGLVHAQDDPIEYPEKGTGAVATYTAVDPDGSAIVSWTLDGADAGDFKIEDGVLNFKKTPDYETPKGGGQDEGDTDNIYMVTVQATDATKRVGMKGSDRRGHERGGGRQHAPFGRAAPGRDQLLRHRRR